MATRWEVTKAVRASTELRPPSRLIMLTLADMADVKTAAIPARHTPSLTNLARQTGLDRSTVTRHLGQLEAAGWIERQRPHPAAARLRGERTCYRLALPTNVGAPSTHLNAPDSHLGADSTHLGAPATHPGRITRPDLGADNHTPGRTTHPNNQILTETRSITPQAPDAVVEELCTRLADRVAANGAARPTITDAWRRETRLLLERDGKTAEQIKTAIDWATSHTFWHTHVLSMSTLRKQYERLALQAQAEARASPPAHRPWTAYPDDSVYDEDL